MKKLRIKKNGGAELSREITDGSTVFRVRRNQFTNNKFEVSDPSKAILKEPLLFDTHTEAEAFIVKAMDGVVEKEPMLERCNVEGEMGWRWKDAPTCHIGTGARKKAIADGRKKLDSEMGDIWAL